MNENKEKNWQLIYKSIIGILSLIIIAGSIYLITSYKKDVARVKDEYINSRIEYDNAHARILEEEIAWEEELIKTHNEAISLSEELSDIYKEREAEKLAEEERWNSLSKEEQDAEQKCIAYNEMVSYLRANNTEYANLYTQYATYLDQDIFNLDDEALLNYTDLYRKKASIEKKYMEENSF